MLHEDLFVLYEWMDLPRVVEIFHLGDFKIAHRYGNGQRFRF
jgi:hypothetical protein